MNSCKIDHLRILLDDKFIDILAVSKTWFNSTISDDEVGITGYSLHRKDRVSGGGGGVALYVKSTIPLKKSL